MSDFLEPIGNEEAILQNILGANNELLPPMSRNEKILLDILGEDYPIDPPMSRIEALLIALKEKIEHDTPSGKITITENGNDIDIAQYATADVAVPTADLGTKSITANGTYEASDDNLDGYDEVTVNVPMPDEYPIGGSLAEATCTGYKFPSNITSIKERMFQDVTTLQNVEIPNGVSDIPWYMLSGCINLERVQMPTTVTRMLGNCFMNCKKLELEELPSSLTFIGQYNFFNCEKITVKEIPAGVTAIGANSFSGCKALTEMTFLGTVTSGMKGGAFNGCTNILKYDFTASQSVPPLESINVFTNINANCKIVVPDSLYDTWIAESNWAAYVSYIVRESDYVGA